MSRLSQLKNINEDQLATYLASQDTKSSKFNTQDDRYWKPTIDKEGNGSATIRFLPAKEGETAPIVSYQSYAFQDKGTKQWYIERSLASLGKTDPCSEYYFQLMGKNLTEKAKNINRRTNYIANILVVKDPAKPENNGKVFLFRFGKKIYDKIIALMKPMDPDDPRIDPFHMIVGCNFRLRQTKVQNFPNYDNSQWEQQSPISKNDQVLEQIDDSIYSLQEEISTDKFKTYEELKARLAVVVGANEQSSAQYQSKNSHTDDDDDDADFLSKIGSNNDDDEIPF